MLLIGTAKAAIREVTIENVVEDTINQIVFLDYKSECGLLDDW